MHLENILLSCFGVRPLRNPWRKGPSGATLEAVQRMVHMSKCFLQNFPKKLKDLKKTTQSFGGNVPQVASRKLGKKDPGLISAAGWPVTLSMYSLSCSMVDSLSWSVIFCHWELPLRFLYFSCTTLKFFPIGWLRRVSNWASSDGVIVPRPRLWHQGQRICKNVFFVLHKTNFMSKLIISNHTIFFLRQLLVHSTLLHNIFA